MNRSDNLSIQPKHSQVKIESFVNGINDKGVKIEVFVECSNPDCPNHKDGFLAPINFDPVNFFTGS